MRILPALTGVALIVTSTVATAASLYSADRYEALHADTRAHETGDVVTVRVVEIASASTSANTDTEKNVSLGGQVRADDITHRGSLDFDNNFDGGGRIQREGRLVATVTATVTDVFPNGDIALTGRQLIEVNGDKQVIMVTGRARRRDITSDNSILSTRLADSDIRYLGEGLLERKQRQGVLQWFMDFIF